MTHEGTRIVLVRHGHTSANGSPGGMRLSGWTDTPLSAAGRAEASAVAAIAPRIGPFAAIYASPLRRARHTARPIEAALGLAARVEPGLREIHCGEVDGLTVEEVQRRFAGAWLENAAERDEHFRWPGGESYREFRARCLRTTRAIAARHPGEAVLLVTHAGFISQLLGTIAGITCARWSAFRSRNASVSVIAWSRRRREIVAFDRHAHLLRPSLATPLPRDG